jgi:hypothetical protein
MSSLGQGLEVSWRSEASQWAGGTLKALATIALSALMVWVVVTVVMDSGLLTTQTPEHRDPAAVSPSAEVAYG